MGEAHEIVQDDSQIFPIGSVSESSGCQTIIGDRIYVIGDSENKENLPLGVRIFSKSMGRWVIPTELGTKPYSCKGHLAVHIHQGRILILKTDSAPQDCAWILEVDTAFVREQKKLLGTEVVAWSKGIIGDDLRPIVISGPSGVGKGTLISKLMKEYPNTFGFSVSHTTRFPRDKEVDGMHYHFTEKSLMEKDIKDGKFLEYASVHGNLYGTSIAAVEAVMNAGKRCILDIDVQGAKSVKASSLEVISIFICPPSFDVLEKRLRARGTETEEQVQKRLRNAKAELDQGKTSGLFDHILVNDDLETCYMNLKEILGLDEKSNDNSSHSARLMSEIDKKSLICCETTEMGKPPHSLFVLDVSSIKGGAPGQTRGLKVYTYDPSTNGLKKLESHYSISP